MRPLATRRFDWAQLAMVACGLLLPPLALGAVLYSMLAPPDDGTARPAEAEAVLPDDRPPVAVPVGLPATTAASPPIAGRQSPSSLSAEGKAPDQSAPIQVITVPAVAVNPPTYATEGAASPSPAESAAPKRSIPHRPQRQPQQQQQQQQDPVKALLQQIGILPPYH
jgi:hypothetical protein